jgi:Tfp pilus assembly protein PilN
MLNAKVADKRAEADSLRAAVAAKPHPAPQPQQSDTVDAALQQEQQARTAALAGALGHRIAWDRLLRDVSLVVPDSISLTKMTATGGGSKDATDPTVPPAPGTTTSETAVTLEGYSAKSGDDVAVFLSRLAVLPELSAVKLQTVTRAERGSHEVIQFVIEAVAKPATGATQ